nr:hypothetical protein Iba_chr09dCG3010 [Ipomoea batatas]
MKDVDVSFDHSSKNTPVLSPAGFAIDQRVHGGQSVGNVVFLCQPATTADKNGKGSEGSQACLHTLCWNVCLKVQTTDSGLLQLPIFTQSLTG